MDSFYQGLGIFVGVIAGVVAGTLVTALINYLQLFRAKKYRIECLKFELIFNKEKINSFIEELQKYRFSVSGDALKTYFGYFQLSSMVYSTANSMYLDGSLYKLIDAPNELVELQKAFRSYTADSEVDFNKNIREYKEICETDEWAKKKPDIVSDLAFWEARFKEDIVILDKLLKKIS